MKYAVALHKDTGTDYGATFPDLPGCFSAGETIEEALANAQEAAECHLEGLLLDDEPVPSPVDIEQHRTSPDYQGAVWAVVDVDISRLSVKSKRVNVTMPERLLQAVDQYARRHGESRSGLLAQAVTEYMAHHG
jgi:predicted RNase H-like HicB family nuclease